MGWLKSSVFTWLGLIGLALFATDKWVTGTLFITGITAIAILDHKKRGYWKNLGISTVDGSKPIFGHLLLAFDKKVYGYEHTERMYQKFKNKKYFGSYMMWRPSLMIADPEIVKAVYIKDFDHFVNRRDITIPEKDKWAGNMLNFAKGAHWKGLRSVLSPTFSSGKMKNMFPLVMEKADVLMKKFHKMIGNGESTVDIKQNFGRLAVDVIGTCAFGLEIDCIGDETAEFEKKLAKASNTDMKFILKFIFEMLFPTIAEYFGWTLFARWGYFKDVMVHTIEQRRIHKVKRGDFVDVILEAQAEQQADSGSTKVEISEDTIIASAVVFLLGGYDTVLNTMVIVAHLVAQHPDKQDKLREELREMVEKDGCLNYQNVMEAKYLEAFIFETQRMHPIAFILERRCTKEYLLPGTNVKLEKDRTVQVPVWSLQNDEKYWKEPSKFNPDRFLPENKGDIIQGTYMPFGLGPRNCIAQRFALMEVKIAIARLVQEFQLSLAPGREELGMKKGPIYKPMDIMPIVLKPVSEE